MDGSRSPGPGDVERLGDDPRQVVRVADEVVVLGHRQGDAVDVDLLERVLADQRARHVAGDRDHRHGVQQGRPDAGHEFVAPAGRAQAHAHPTGDTSVAVRGVGATLLMAHEDVAELRIVAEHVVERQDHAARIAEDDIHALAQERLAQDVRPDARSLEVARFVEHPLAGSLDRGRRGGPVVGHVAPPGGDLGRGRTRWPGRFALRHGHRSGPFFLVSVRTHRKTLASRRGSLRSSVVSGATSARSSGFLRSPAGSP